MIRRIYYRVLEIIYSTLVLVKEEEEKDLKVLFISVQSTSYDTIKRDVRNSLETQLGLLGGTLGLFTGFSILSGVEIIFFVLKFFFRFFGRLKTLMK